MAFALNYFFCCLDLKLGSIIMAWWGMIFSAISIVATVLALLTNKGQFPTYFPVHFSTGNSIISAVIAVLLLLVYFYFSYQLLMGAQNNDSSLMVGYLVIHGIFIIIWVLGIFANASSIVLVVLYVYLWLCVYSFYVKTGGRGIA